MFGKRKHIRHDTHDNSAVVLAAVTRASTYQGGAQVQAESFDFLPAKGQLPIDIP